MQPLAEGRENKYEEYRSLVQEFCALAKKEGLALVAWSGSEPKHFLKLPDEIQAGVVERFRAYVEVCREVQMQGSSLRDDQTFLWRMFQKLRVHPPSDLMDQIQQGEVIEIHNKEFIQVYRNLRFFEICGYSIDDILSRPFWELVSRDQVITGTLVDIGQTLFSGKVLGVIPLNIPEHTVVELDSEGRNLLVVQQRIAAPLRDAHGTVDAAVTFLRCISCTRTVDGEYRSY